MATASAASARTARGRVSGRALPPCRGGALRYIDNVGVAEFVALADRYADQGALYRPTEKLREMARNGQTFFA